MLSLRKIEEFMGVQNFSSKGTALPAQALSTLTTQTLVGGALIGAVVGNAVTPVWGALVGLPVGAALALVVARIMTASFGPAPSYAASNKAIGLSLVIGPSVLAVVGLVTLFTAESAFRGSPVFWAMAAMITSLLWVESLMVGMWWKATFLRSRFGRLQPGRGQIATMPMVQMSALILIATTVLRFTLFLP